MTNERGEGGIVIDATADFRRRQAENARKHGVLKRRKPNPLVIATGAVAALAAAAAVGIKAEPKIVSGVENVFDRVHSGTPLTDEQKTGQMLLETAGEDHILRNIVIDGEDVGGKRIAYARNRPATQINNGEFDRGTVIDTIESGLKVDKALVVSGNDPSTPIEKAAESEWVGFPDPNKNGQFVYVLGSLLDGPSIFQLMAKTPVDVSQ